MMNKRFVINMVSSLLLGAALISAPLQAAEKVVVNISKVDGRQGLPHLAAAAAQHVFPPLARDWQEFHCS